ncbi:PIG-L deacetylase family protein [Horticoccus sp. 23ND18S-11]|uniref:PIG-L deacetylase family protein n=1 Tax=Horticoccus sp. 23ND18S-11 TaxID=3391832 RepID=UPI0039C8CEEF
MNFSRSDADIHLPTGSVGMTPEAALARTTHLCVIAHQDDIEINAYPAVAACYGRADRFFTGVVMTNGAGSARTGKFAATTDAQMQLIRRDEQRRAADLGKYNLQLQLGHSSRDVKDRNHAGVASDLRTIFGGCTSALQEVYLHQPIDKHDTHVACLLRCLEAIRSLPRERRPRRVLGVEGWRDLDWLADADKVAMDASPYPQLAEQLVAVFESQIAGGKRYDLAAMGRRAANATFHSSHATDQATSISWAMDLTPLVQDESLSPLDFALNHVDRLRTDVATRLRQMGA